MRITDRTMLASLGFADPDKGQDEHGLACQFLARPEIAKEMVTRFLRHFAPIPSLKDPTKMLGRFGEPTIKKCDLEVPINKGDGQYRTTIGFLDLVINFQVPELDTYQNAGGEPYQRSFESNYGLAVEVKFGRVSCSDIIRQINLYRQYVGRYHDLYWIAATAFDLSQPDRDSLVNAKIFHVRLGQRFAEWCESVRSETMNGEPRASLVTF